MAQEHPDGNGGIRIVGIPQGEPQDLAYILVQTDLPIIHQLHDGEPGEHLGNRSGPETGVRCNRQVFLAGLFRKIPVAGKMGVDFLSVFVHFHPQPGHMGPVMAHHGVQPGGKVPGFLGRHGFFGQDSLGGQQDGSAQSQGCHPLQMVLRFHKKTSFEQFRISGGKISLFRHCQFPLYR